MNRSVKVLMSSCMRFVAVPAPLAAVLLTLSSAAAAVEPLDTFNFRIGGFVSRFDMEMRADGETATGTPIDLDRDLGLQPDNLLAFAGFSWRPFDRHEFGLSYFQDDSRTNRRLEREIVFEGNVYEILTTVDAGYDLDTYQAYYVWWAASHERWALGAQVGLVWYRMALSIGLQLDANGNEVGGTLEGDVSADLPAPAIGLRWSSTPATDWRISAEAGYFSADINNIDANVTFGRIAVEWFPLERTGGWLDYSVNDLNADVTKDRFAGEIDFLNSGVRLGIVYRF